MVKKNIIRIEPKRVITSLSSSLFIVSTIFLFGPFIIYQGNIDEFLISLRSILSFFFFPALILIILLTVISLVLPEKLHKRYISLLFIIGILFWLQGNVLVWKYGLLDGQGIDWTEGAWRGWLDGSIWILLVFIAYRFFKQLYKITALVSILMFSFQLIFWVVISVQKPETWHEKDEITLSKSMPKELYQFSSKQNIIIFLLDSFQSDIFQDIINDDFDYYSDKLEGFTFFNETTGSFPTTYMTIPALFSGKNYKNDIPMPKFFNNIMKGKTISNVLYKSGYDVDLVDVTGIPVNPGLYSIRYQIPVPYGVTKEHFTQANSALMLDLVFFRYVPHIFKKYIYNDHRWLMQRLLFTHMSILSHKERKIGTTFRYFAHEAFLTDLYNNLTIIRTKSVFKFFHLITTHGPIVVNRDCNYAGKPLKNTRENKINQSRCSLEHIIKILIKLKSKGIYDSSLIVLMADTGDGFKVKLKNLDKGDGFGKKVGSALPLMVIKPPFSKGPLKTSTAQTMIIDLPATISSILNLTEKFTGRSMFEIDPKEVRERKFYYYKWRHENWQADYLKHIDEFIIKGSVFDLASWRKTQIGIPADGITFDIGSSAERERFIQLKEFSMKEISVDKSFHFRWATGKNSKIIFNGLRLPTRSRIMVTFEVAPFIVNRDKKMMIKSQLSTAEVILKPGWSRYDVIVEFPEGETPTLYIYYEEAASPKSLGINNDTRQLSVRWNRLSLSYAPASKT